jgi:hypothetical protein
MYRSLFLVSPHLDRSRTPFPCSWFLRTRAGHVPSLDLGFHALFLVSPLSRFAFVNTLPNPLSFAALALLLLRSLSSSSLLSFCLARVCCFVTRFLSGTYIHASILVLQSRIVGSRMCFDSYVSFCFTSLMWKHSRLCVCVRERDGRTCARVRFLSYVYL